MSEPLIAAYLDRDLDPAAAAELLAAVRADPVLRERLVALARVERILAAGLGPVAIDRAVADALARPDPAWVEGTMRAVRATVLRRGRRLPRRRPALRLAPLLVAAALVLAVAVAWLAVPPAAEPAAPAASSPVALAIAGDGLLRDGAAVPSGDALADGAILEAGPGGGAWRYPDGTIVALADGSAARIAATAAAGKDIVLRRGRLEATVAPQPAGRPLLASAGDLSLTVVGTRFSLSLEGAPRLAVAEGHVRARAGGSEALVGPGQAFTAAAEGGRFATWAAAGGWRALVSGGTVSPAGTAGSIATTAAQRNPWFDPEQCLCLQSDAGVGDGELLRVPAGASVRLRLRAARAGEVRLTLEAPVGAAVAERVHGSGRFAVGPAWREIVLAPGDLDDGHGIPAGAPVRTICLWGFGTGVLELAAIAIERPVP